MYLRTCLMLVLASSLTNAQLWTSSSGAVFAQARSATEDRSTVHRLFSEGKYEEEIELRKTLMKEARDRHAIASDRSYVAAAASTLLLPIEDQQTVTRSRERLQLGKSLIDEGKFEQAIDCLSEALHAYSAVLNDDIVSIECQERLSAAMMVLDDSVRAKPHCENATAKAALLLGDSHPYIAELNIQLAQIHIQMRDWEPAGKSLQKARDIMQKLDMEEYPVFGRLQLFEAKLHNELGRYEEAQQLAKAASSVLAFAGAEWEVNLAISQGELGRAYERAGKYTQSYQAFRRCVDIFNRYEKKVASNRTQLTILESYGITLDNVNRPKDASTVRHHIEQVKARIQTQSNRSRR